MNYRSVLFTLVVLGSFWACQQQETQPRNKLQVEIEEMESQMEDDVSMDTAMAFRLSNAYIRFAGENPKDSSSPYYLNRAADILKEIPGKRLKAVNLYNDIFVKYPEHPLAPRGVFMIGFVFDEKYNDAERAAKSYRFFLEKYPEHPLAGDAENLLALLEDTTGGELEQIHQWMNKNDSINTPDRH